jgi:hypothetical protein
MPQEQKTYKNVMEIFVDDEIQHQLTNNQTLGNIKGYLNLLEVATFALNRLPNLYASSLEGIERQRRKLKQDSVLRRKIAQAVSQAFAAVERDPLKRSTPIEQEQNDVIQEAKETLLELENFVPKQELAWIVSFMESFLFNINNRQMNDEEVVKLYYLLYYYWQENQ